ncbi:sugar transferase, partial [Klebsiella pneumoniae]|uniref:sugar transferase n=1 Tax=Klebsiella pneumoniae TaxID=573 RepID=UPI002164D959
DVFAGKKSAQIREILISESAWEEMTCLFAPSLSKPGMTGLWQVSGRSDVDYETRVYLDAWYVKNWSMWNDIAILFKTISVVLRKDGAY